jgi:hypothetical protein
MEVWLASTQNEQAENGADIEDPHSHASKGQQSPKAPGHYVDKCEDER